MPEKYSLEFFDKTDDYDNIISIFQDSRWSSKICWSVWSDGDTLVDDSLVNEKQKKGLDETSEDWEVADNGLQRIHSFSPLGQ